MGTVVRVEDLFFNVPARLKFLKQDTTERRVIDNLLTRYALAYPLVRFKLVDKGTPTLQTTGDGDRRAILASLYGVETARQMLEVGVNDDGLTLSGFISPTSLTRSNRKDITFFVNGRWVQDVALTTALMQAYHTLLMVGRYPMAAVFLEISPEEVDVNVHPQKAEIRFRESRPGLQFCSACHPPILAGVHTSATDAGAEPVGERQVVIAWLGLVHCPFNGWK